jgi:aryl-alcohol dehydrogenase-like predicted oxidoreductase
VAAYQLAEEEGFVAPQAEQLQYNIFVRDKVEVGFAPLCESLGLGITTWSPLAYGLLTGRYDDGIPDDARLGRSKYRWLRESALGADEAAMLRRVRAVNALAREAGTTPSRLALAWVLRNSAVATAISGASSVDQLREKWDLVPRRHDIRTKRPMDSFGPRPEAPSRCRSLSVSGDKSTSTINR